MSEKAVTSQLKINCEEEASILARLSSEYAVEEDERRLRFLQNERCVAHFYPPLLKWDAGKGQLESGTYMVLIIQAGATAVGVWDGSLLVAHKVIKKYVKRGKGKAQTTYLKTRGKSRYGSRLRLQNAQAHLVETVDRVDMWCDQYAVKKLFYNCPVRLWSEFDKTFEGLHGVERIKVPRDVRTPNHEELKRVRNSLCWGTLDLFDPSLLEFIEK